MQIKRFEANTMAEALSIVKSELGPDAVILSTKSTRRGAGAFGLFGKPMVEVTAAVDRTPADRTKAGTAVPPSVSRGSERLSYEWRDVGEISTLREEIRDLKELVSELRDMGRRSIPKGSQVPGGFEGIYTDMLSAGVAPRLAGKVVVKGAEMLAGVSDSAKGGMTVKEVIAGVIMEMIKVSGGICTDGRKGKCVAFVGPTGVGKTTTIAKVAAQQTMIGKDVAMITIDTYRIGAVEQLKLYGRILKVPVVEASTVRELRERIESFRDKDLILIDTAGRSHRDDSQISFLGQFFPDGESSPELHLLISATTKEGDIKEILKRFGRLPIRRYVFTKLDESTSFGSLLNVAAGYRVPYSYFTTGRRVPEDLEAATPERVADLILRIREEMEGAERIINRGTGIWTRRQR